MYLLFWAVKNQLNGIGHSSIPFQYSIPPFPFQEALILDNILVVH